MQAEMPLRNATILETRTQRAEFAAGSPNPLDGNFRVRGQAAPETDLASVSAKDLGFVKQIQDFSDQPALAVDAKVLVVRRHPAILDGHQFITNRPIKVLDVAPYPDLRAQVVSMFGGGSFELRLVRVHGDVEAGQYDLLNKMTFSQDVATRPPKPDHVASDLHTNTGAAVNPNDLAYGPGADGEQIRNLQNERRRAIVEREIKSHRSQSHLEDMRALEMEERIEEQRLARKLAGQREEQRSFLEVRAEMDRERNRSDDRMATLFSTMQKQNADMVQAMMESKKNDGNDNNGAMVAALMKATSDSTMAMMRMFADMNSSRREDSEKVAMLQAEHTKAMVAMMTAMQTQSIEQMRAASEKSESLVERMISLRTDVPEQRFKEIIAAKESGKQEAKEWFQMIQELQGQAATEDDLSWDPDGSVAGNIGSLLFHGIKRLLGGAGGGQMADLLNRILNKSPENRSYSDAEIAAAAARIQPYVASPSHPALPTPAPATFPPGMQPAGPAARGPQLPLQGYGAGQTIPGLQQQQANRPQPGQVFQSGAAAATVPVQPPAPVPTPVDMSGMSGTNPAVGDQEFDSPEARLRDHLNDVMREIVADVTDRRHVHQWPFSAFEVLNASFLDELLGQKDDGARIVLLQKFVDPTLYRHLVELFWRPENAEQYKAFIQGLQTLTQLHREAKERANAGAA